MTALISLWMAPGAGVASEKESATRPWSDEVVYVVIEGKFFDGDPSNNMMLKRFGANKKNYAGCGYWGGDLKGVQKKLDYLQTLGVTTLLLYPVMLNDREPCGKWLPSGYRPRDYFRIDENLGTMEDLKNLVSDAHKRGIRIVLDMPLGIPGLEHPFYTDRAKKTWFGDSTVYGVRRWNTDNTAVADYLISVGKFWRNKCDGFRMDSCQLHSIGFWKRFTTEIRSDPGFSDFFLLGEEVVPPKDIGLFLRETGFDSAYDFSFGVVRKVLGRGESPNKMIAFWDNCKKFYPKPPNMVVQLGDYEAFAQWALKPTVERTRLAMAFILTVNRVPFIYPGDEQAMAFDETCALFTSLDETRTNSLKWTRTLIALRKKEPALRQGTLTDLRARHGILSFIRTSGKDRILVAMNTTESQQDIQVDIPGTSWHNAALRDLIENSDVKPKNSDTPLPIPAFGIRILKGM